jgi:hypothetical protein
MKSIAAGLSWAYPDPILPDCAEAYDQCKPWRWPEQTRANVQAWGATTHQPVPTTSASGVAAGTMSALYSSI